MKISEVANLYDTTSVALRYYEKEGLLSKVNRNEVGVRDYNEENLERVEFIVCMRNAGVSVKTLKNYINLYHQGDTTFNERLNLLKNEQNQLKEKRNEIDETIKYLDTKIATYIK